MAALMVIVAAVFDFFDGFAARGLKAYSPIGKELDSLADDVSFGVAPSVAIYSYLDGLPRMDGLNECISGLGDIVPFVAFLIAAFSALRLAKFNIDERQTMSFIGLPVPANALFWSFLIATLNHHSLRLGYSGIVTLFAVELLFCYLMVSEIPMFSLKFHDYKIENNRLRYLFLAICTVLIMTLRMASFPVIILLYIVLSILNDILTKKKSENV